VFLGHCALGRGATPTGCNDALASIGLGVMSQVTGLFGRPAAHRHLHAWPLSTWRWRGCRPTLWVWVFALVFYDFCYYWLHRAGHRVAVLWAAHVVHHQSEDYNLSTALRQTSSGFLLGWIFYLPMAVAGVPPLVFGVVALIDLLYQYWVHTQQIGRLGWFDRWFCSPSNHRVHHAVNERYLDKNYGGILIVWDRLFGTFIEEDAAEPCVYGTRAPLRSFNPLWANLQVYRDLAQDSWRARAWGDKLRVWLKPARLAAGRRGGTLAQTGV
jgi:sterol desaturase/sphingolipid hydroxylase (fatty acid hydroxylase superfamily)